MPEQSRPGRMERGDAIPASWLRKVADAVVQRISIVGGRVSKRGTSIQIEVDTPPRGGGESTRLAIVTGSTASGNRWEYDVSYPAEKSAPGYGNWQAASGATSVTAFNLWEEIDPTTRVTQDPNGDGTDELTLEPLPDGSPVLIRKVADGSGDSEWWIVAGGVPVDASTDCEAE